MTFDILRLSLEGSLGSGEVWSVNPCFMFGDFANPDPTVAQMNAAAVAVNAIDPGSTTRQHMTTGARIVGCRLEARKLTGELVIVSENNRATPLAGTGNPVAPAQTSVVVSLRTERAGGRGRGRLYMPVLGAGLVPATLRWDPTQQQVYLDEQKTYWSAVETALTTALGLAPASMCVWSREGVFATPVNALQVGNVLDTQRRRRDAFPESYLSVSM